MEIDVRFLQTVVSNEGFRSHDSNPARLRLLDDLLDLAARESASLLVLPAGFFTATCPEEVPQHIDEVARRADRAKIAVIGGVVHIDPSVDLRAGAWLTTVLRDCRLTAHRGAAMATGNSKGRFADFRSSSDCPRLQPDPYVLKEMDRIVDTFTNEAAYLRFPEGFIGTLKDNVVEAFRRLDAIDREDPFWNGTNRRPTQSKLDSACEIALRANSLDCEALWLKAAVHTVFGWSFDPELWERLALACPVDPTWIVYSALYAECYGSYDTVPNLVDLLKRLQSCDCVAALLKGMIAGGPDQPGRAILSREYSADWANRVLNLCGSVN